MDVLKKHYETLTILGGMLVIVVGCCMWINSKFSAIDEKFAASDEKFTMSNSRIEQRLVRIETVLIMQGIMPKEMAVKKQCTPENHG